MAMDPNSDGVRIYITDVGNDIYEEINEVTSGDAGKNYGWNVREGK